MGSRQLWMRAMVALGSVGAPLSHETAVHTGEVSVAGDRGVLINHLSCDNPASPVGKGACVEKTEQTCAEVLCFPESGLSGL